MQVGKCDTLWRLFCSRVPLGFIKKLGRIKDARQCGYLKSQVSVECSALISRLEVQGWRGHAQPYLPSLPGCTEKQTFHLGSNIAQYLHSRWSLELSKNPINTRLEQMKPTSSLQDSCSCLSVLSKCCKSYCRNTEYFHRKPFPSPGRFIRCHGNQNRQLQWK